MKETEISTKTKTTVTVPVELIMEILSYLPAKSLLNSSKRVCKSWHSLVEEPDFIKKHLNRGAINGGGGGGRGTSSSSSSSSSSSNGNTNYQSLMCRSAGNKISRLQLPFNFEDDISPNINSGDDDTVLTITPTTLKVDSSSLFRYWRSELVCSCNGLLCISNGESIILLNPCTREHKFLPKEPLQYRNISLPISYGFGCFYDSTTTTTTTTTAVADQYKIVRIEHSLRSKSETTSSKSEVKVYSLATNSWRTIKDIPDDILEMVTKTTNYQSGVFLNGALHWMSHVTSDLVSFDMRSEEFRIMPRPPYDGNDDFKVLMIMRGCLGMIRMRGFGDFYLEISIMKEYGTSTWTREFGIKLIPSYIGLYGIGSILWLDDQILYEGIGHNRLVVYDMNKKMTAYIDIQNPGYGTKSTEPHLRSVGKIIPCIESLVSLKSSKLTLSKDKKRRVLETIHTEIK